jgi:hypothetical protein
VGKVAKELVFRFPPSVSLHQTNYIADLEILTDLSINVGSLYFTYKTDRRRFDIKLLVLL